MGRLFKAFLFKLTRDLTFRITLIIGAGFALLISGLFLAMDLMTHAVESSDRLLTGENMLSISLIPAQTYSLAVPINVAIFVCLEFTQGSIRNKIIAGNSKFNIYLSLFLSGLFFCFALMGVYVLLCFGIGCIFGGFDPNGSYFMNGLNFTPEYLIKLLIGSIFVYISIVSFTIFIATTLRNVGPCIPIIIVLLLILSYIAPIITSINTLLGEDAEGLIWFMRIVDPLYCTSESTFTINDDTRQIQMNILNETFISGICSNIFYAAIFFGFGALEFTKRDVK